MAIESAPMAHGQETITQVLILLGVTVSIVGAFRWVHMPPILGYLAVGILLGPGVLGVMADSATMSLLSEFGVVFLLFVIGLEFSLTQMIAMRRLVLGLGGLQVLVTIPIIGLIALGVGLEWRTAFVIGAALALSSTAVIVKQLTEEGELQTPHGRAAIGTLLFQDVAVIPLLILIPALGGSEGAGLATLLGLALAKAIVAFGVILAVGRYLLRPLFHLVARARSPELFTLTVLFVTVAAAWGTQSLGLSLALGAFLAGMMLSETEYRHQIEADIRPFQDILLGLFFISIGMLLDPSIVLVQVHWVLIAVLALMGGKLVIIFLIMRGLGYERDVAARVGLILGNGGEFGFVLLALATDYALLPDLAKQVVIAAIIVSLALTPVIIRSSAGLAARFAPPRAGRTHEDCEVRIEAYEGEMAGYRDHVILLGFGRVGQNVARFLDEHGFRWLALDLDPLLIQNARAAGKPVFYGDATRSHVLRAAGIERARVAVVGFNEGRATRKVVHQLRALDSELPILVRTTDDSEIEAVRAAGATEVVPEVLEGSLMVASHVLFMLGVPSDRVIAGIQAVWADRYTSMRSFFHGSEAPTVDRSEAIRDRLQSITLAPDTVAVGKPAERLPLNRLGVRIDSICRDGICELDPDLRHPLKAGDVVVLFGAPEALNRAEQWLAGKARRHLWPKAGRRALRRWRRRLRGDRVAGDAES